MIYDALFEGQLMPAERALLARAVRENRPSLVLEIGTWKGGGSTWQIANALRDNDHGILHTCDTDPEHISIAQSIYNQEWSRFVQVHHQSSTQLISNLIAAATIPDFVFFDGPEDPQLSLDDFNLLDQHLKSGALFSMHDWDLSRVDGTTSIKAKLLRPALENNRGWKILKQLTAPESVGIVLARKL